MVRYWSCAPAKRTFGAGGEWLDIGALLAVTAGEGALRGDNALAGDRGASTAEIVLFLNEFISYL